MDRQGSLMYDSKQDTLKHKKIVKELMTEVINELKKRANNHDNSKLHSPEKPIFDEYTPKLTNTTYGSNEYKQYLKEMQVALNHHYAHNRHHPEYFENGVQGMTLIDICEMLCDWKAATLRHTDGDVFKSVEINQERFGYGDELKQIFINTIHDWHEPKEAKSKCDKI